MINAESSYSKTVAAVQNSDQVKVAQNPVITQPEQTAAERSPQPKPSVFASKYPHLNEIEERLKEQNKAIFGREKKRDKLKKGLSSIVKEYHFDSVIRNSMLQKENILIVRWLVQSMKKLQK